MGVYLRAHIFPYDPKQPFQMDTNPYKLFDLLGDKQNGPYVVKSAVDYVAIGTIPDRGEIGGALTLFNPKTGKHEVYRYNIKGHSIIKLKFYDDYLYGGTSISGGAQANHLGDEDGTLFIFDIESKQLVYVPVPIDEEKGIGGLTIDDQGYLWGLTAGKLFKFDLENTEVLETKNLYPFE